MSDTVRINNILIKNSLGNSSSNQNIGNSGVMTFGGYKTAQSRASKKTSKKQHKSKKYQKSQNDLSDLLDVKHLVANKDYLSSKKL